MTNVLDCGRTVRAYNHKVNASVSAMKCCHYDMQDDIAPSSAPEVASSYATTWVRVGVNRAQALYDTVASSVFHMFPFCSIEFWTMYSASFS